MRVFITGVGGTIGRAFVELLHKDYHVVGVDRNETNVAWLKRNYPDIEVSCGDFGDVTFIEDGVDILIHLAAMKHIDLCEANPNECVSNNVVKTYKLFRNAYENGVKILFMSTDKAVEPNSAYGFSKALGEAMAWEYGGAFVRSGNVVASSGSVLNIWDEAIEKGESIKITHRNMKRYFINVESLVNQAWAQYSAGVKTIIPKMDRNVFLLELAEEKLNKYGYTIDNYPGGIEYIGLRLGEKIEEKLEWPKSEL